MKTKAPRPMSPSQTESAKKRLLERRSRLAHGLRAQLGVLRRSDRKRVSDAGDIATDDLQDLQSLQLAEMGVRKLRKIDGAIRRVEAGAADICEGCGGPIGRRRLRALPETTHCLGCQEELEGTAASGESEERWSVVVEAEAELQRALGDPDERLDGVDRD